MTEELRAMGQKIRWNGSVPHRGDATRPPLHGKRIKGQQKTRNREAAATCCASSLSVCRTKNEERSDASSPPPPPLMFVGTITASLDDRGVEGATGQKKSTNKGEKTPTQEECVCRKRAACMYVCVCVCAGRWRQTFCRRRFCFLFLGCLLCFDIYLWQGQRHRIVSSTLKRCLAPPSYTRRC